MNHGTQNNETLAEDEDASILPMTLSGVIILLLVMVLSYFTLKEQERQKRLRKKKRRKKKSGEAPLSRGEAKMNEENESKGKEK